MRTRLLVLSIDDICRLFADYASLTGFPRDAVCDTLFANPATRRLRLRIESPTLGPHESPEEIRFDLQRSFLVN